MLLTSRDSRDSESNFDYSGRYCSCWPLFASGDELLPAVDVVGCAREGRVGHDVYGERGDVGRPDDAPDGKRGAKLIAAVFEFIAEQ